jgi:hypothetical protein
LYREYLITHNKENRIFDNDDMPLWDLTHLSLSYKSRILINIYIFIDIIEIDNLKSLDKLEKL